MGRRTAIVQTAGVGREFLPTSYYYSYYYYSYYNYSYSCYYYYY